MVNAFHFRTFYNQMFDDHIAPQEIQEIYKIFYEYATRDMGLQEAKSFPQREIVAAIEGSVLESAIEKAADYFKTWKDVVSKRRTYVQDPVSNELVKLLLRIKRKLSRRR